MTKRDLVGVAGQSNLESELETFSDRVSPKRNENFPLVIDGEFDFGAVCVRFELLDWPAEVFESVESSGGCGF